MPVRPNMDRTGRDVCPCVSKIAPGRTVMFVCCGCVQASVSLSLVVQISLPAMPHHGKKSPGCKAKCKLLKKLREFQLLLRPKCARRVNPGVSRIPAPPEHLGPQGFTMKSEDPVPLLPRPEGKSEDEGMMSSVGDDDHCHNMIKLSNDMATFLRHTVYDDGLLDENGWIELSCCCAMLHCSEDEATKAMKLSDRHDDHWGCGA